MLTEVRNMRSVFKVTVNENDMSPFKLMRLLDIKDGKLVSPVFDWDTPQKFSNRRQIYLYSEESVGFDEGDIGVWKWSATHNQNDYEKDYIVKSFDADIVPIEICIIKDLGKDQESKQVIKMLDSGRIKYTSSQVMLSWKSSNTEYTGIFLSRQDSVNNNGKLGLKPNVYQLPQYTFTNKEMIETERRRFYCHLELLKNPDCYVWVKDQISIVKDVFLEKINWAELKSSGFTRQEYQNIKKYIDTCDKDVFLEEIKTRCMCSDEEAQKLISRFVEMASIRLVGDTVTDNTLLQLIYRNPELEKRASALVTESWKKSHETEIEKAQKELDRVTNALDKKQEYRDKLDEELADKKTALTELVNNISDYEKLSNEIEGSVNKKIEDAKANVSEFVSEMVFLSSVQSGTNTSENSRAISSSGCEIVQRGIPFDGDPDINDSWKEELQSIETEMKEAGVGEKYEAGLAATLYACYVNNYPVMLAGPYGDSIARAFSVSLNCCLPAVIDCCKGVSSEVFNNIDEQVVLIKNPFEPGARDIVLQAISEHSNFFILTSPVFDDLKIEPIGMLNYYFPISTAMFIEDRPKERFLGGKRYKNFSAYQSKGIKKFKYSSVFNMMGINGFAEHRINNVISDARNMNSTLSVGYEYLYFLITLALLTSSESVAREAIENEKNDEVKTYSKVFLGEE